MCVWDFRYFEHVYENYMSICSNHLKSAKDQPLTWQMANRVFWNATSQATPSLVRQNSWVSGAAGNHESAEASSAGEMHELPKADCEWMALDEW